jgi:N-terminal domain of (some) glycogen debranching enzymes
MAFKVQVGQPQISIHQGQTVLIGELDGQVNWPSEKGLYFLDTRLISSWAIYANGVSWQLLNGGAITHYAARISLTNRDFAVPGPREPLQVRSRGEPPRVQGGRVARGGGAHGS